MKKRLSKKKAGTTTKQPKGKGRHDVSKHPKGNTNGFAANPQNINRKGRPRNIIKDLEEKIGTEFKVQISKDDKIQLIASLLEMPLTDLQAIVDDETSPVFMVVIASGLIADVRKGSMSTLSALSGNTIKAPQASTDGNKNGEGLPPPTVLKLEYSPEDIDVEIITSEAEMEERYNDYELTEETE